MLHATGTKDMEKLGGLMKRMPWTGAVMMVGAVALSALPPLNGFVSEWLLYLSLMKCGLATHGGHGLTALLAVGLVALVGGLAAITSCVSRASSSWVRPAPKRPTGPTNRRAGCSRRW